jgi:hypothetical protein
MFKDLFSLKGRVALVTGGSRGIGKMIAAGFLAHGAARVYITARKAGPCEATAKELSAQYDGECIALGIDISTVEGCEKLAAEIIKREPKLNILVNNAGAAWGADFDEFPESGWDKVMDLNVKSLFFLTKALAKPLRAAATHEQPAKVIFRRRYLRQPAGDLFLRGEQGGGDPSDAAHGDQVDQGLHRRHRDCAGRLLFGHEQGRTRPRRRGGQAHSGAAHRHRRGHGGRCDLSRLARRRLCRRQHHRGGRRRGVCECGVAGRGVRWRAHLSP